MLNTIKTKLFFLMFGSTCYSQTTFYLKPIVEIKINHSFESGLGTGSHYHWPSNDYFRLENHSWFMTGNLSIGVDAGIIYKRKHYFEFGMATDEVGMKTTLHSLSAYTDSKQENFVFAAHNTSHFTFQMIRFNFNYQYEFLHTKFIRGRIQTGFNLLFNPYVKNGQFDTFTSPAFGLEMINQENVMVANKSENIYSYRKRLAPAFSLGLGVDFNTRNHYLFSLGINYQQGIFKNVIASHSTPVSINGNVANYVLYSESRSSGFIFQVSRRFQLYPWRPNKKDKVISDF